MYPPPDVPPRVMYGCGKECCTKHAVMDAGPWLLRLPTATKCIVHAHAVLCPAQVLAIPLPRRPLFPGNIMPVSVHNPKLVKELQELKKTGWGTTFPCMAFRCWKSTAVVSVHLSMYGEGYPTCAERAAPLSSLAHVHHLLTGWCSRAVFQLLATQPDADAVPWVCRAAARRMWGRSCAPQQWLHQDWMRRRRGNRALRSRMMAAAPP